MSIYFIISNLMRENLSYSSQNKEGYLSKYPSFGGGRWIRTIEVSDNRFTVCPLWPLGNSSLIGAGNRNRTYNLLITSQLLCQLSYASILNFHGGHNRARTCDPLLVRQMLSQLSYAPMIF